MAGDGERSERSTSIRRRLTKSLKQVVSYAKSRKSSVSGSSSREPASQPAPLPQGPTTEQSSIQQTVPSSSVPAPVSATAASSTIATKDVPAKITTAKMSSKYRPPKNSTPAPPPMSAAERAQDLFKKHGLDIKTSDWPFPSAPPVERIQKDIRMRVRRTCHKCETSFGPDKVCGKCGHKRCKGCPRYPAKKSKGKGKEKVTTKTALGYKKRRGDIAYGLTIPNRRGGPDLVYKPIRQRVHRSCHRCITDFGGEKICSNCKHTRCKSCPRFPNKGKPEYNLNDPDDSEPECPRFPRRTYRRPRVRIHWVCSKCSTTFTEKTKICTCCSSNRDDTGVRYPPKKLKYQPTDQEEQRLNDRLKQINISDA